MLLNAYGGQKWPLYVEQICREELSEKEALPLIMSDLKISLEEAVAFLLSEVDFDPGFSDFVHWCEEQGFPVVIFSGGFEELIRPLLRREGYGKLPVRANSVEVVDGHWSVRSHQGFRICDRQNHCKCGSVKSSGPSSDLIVYVGDGHTDRCPVQIADIVFAKAFLQNYCERRQLSFYPYESFADVQDRLSQVLEGEEELLRTESLPLG